MELDLKVKNRRHAREAIVIALNGRCTESNASRAVIFLYSDLNFSLLAFLYLRSFLLYALVQLQKKKNAPVKNYSRKVRKLTSSPSYANSTYIYT